MKKLAPVGHNQDFLGVQRESEWRLKGTAVKNLTVAEFPVLSLKKETSKSDECLVFWHLQQIFPK